MTAPQTKALPDTSSAGLAPATHTALEAHCGLVDIPAGTTLTVTQLDKLLETPPLLMCAATHFGIAESPFENAFTQHSLHAAHLPAVDLHEQAHWEHHALLAAYRYFGHHVTLMPAQPGALDGIFCTDSDKSFQSFYHMGDNRWQAGRPFSILPTFTHTRRQEEADWKLRFLRLGLQNPDRDAHRQVYRLAPAMEFGDTRIIFHDVHPGKGDGGFVLAGLAENTEEAMGRSTLEGHIAFRDILQRELGSAAELHSIALRQPFYHLDTAGIDGANGEFFTHPRAFQPEGWEKIQSLFGDKLVILPEEDLFAFCGNGTAFGKRIFVADTLSKAGQQLMRERGYDVIMTPIRAICQGGGGHRCMTSVHPELYVPGGYRLSGVDFNTPGQSYRVEVVPEDNRIMLQHLPDNSPPEDIASLMPFAGEF